MTLSDAKIRDGGLSEKVIDLMVQVVERAFDQATVPLRTGDFFIAKTFRHGPRPFENLDHMGDGQLLINIGYRLRATNHKRNLVYPFYVIPDEETAE